MSVTSAVSMSMLTAPTIFARWPRISTKPWSSRRRSRPSAYPAGMTAKVTGRAAVNRPPYPTVSPTRIPFTATTWLVSDMTGFRAIVEPSGGGTRPYSRRPGRTKSNHTRESRSSAAELAA